MAIIPKEEAEADENVWTSGVGCCCCREDAEDMSAPPPATAAKLDSLSGLTGAATTVVDVDMKPAKKEVLEAAAPTLLRSEEEAAVVALARVAVAGLARLVVLADLAVLDALTGFKICSCCICC